MQIMKALTWPMAVAIPLAACAQLEQPPRTLLPVPYAYLSLTTCRHYPSNIVECQLDYGTQFGRHRLGPVQQVSREFATNLDDSRYQISACWPVSRIQRELPNFTCRIYHGQSGADAGSVLIKGELPFVWLGSWKDRDQIVYRWKQDCWSRLHD
ncbi:hypothetical protein [Agrobacterium fabrum]|uniref:hypothetical protein n=1 Tax=Agrobacterium fabrum TaxID=1176649 RepID=UPI0021584F17|nr:hypothetical protein [Agrobacterium fabrum]MCR6727858.1 hypothetical protein [Agrobacterium fabrum]